LVHYDKGEAMRLTAILLLIFMAAARAEIYKSIDADGEVIYSDQPSRGAERVSMPTLPTYTPPRSPGVVGRTASAVAEPQHYESFSLTSPVNEATIRNNLGTVEIEASLTPSLMTELGHGIQFYLDGVAYGAVTNRTTMTLGNVDRGTHQLSARVMDASGKVLLATTEITVFVKRASKLHGGKQGTVTDNPGYITANPNVVGDETFQPYRYKDIADYSGTAAVKDDPELAEQLANPGFRNRNPNILSPNPNIHSFNPNQINPPLPKED
jgi:hypothetical protein